MFILFEFCRRGEGGGRALCASHDIDSLEKYAQNWSLVGMCKGNEWKCIAKGEDFACYSCGGWWYEIQKIDVI